jgi:hypothetical protein
MKPAVQHIRTFGFGRALQFGRQSKQNRKGRDQWVVPCPCLLNTRWCLIHPRCILAARMSGQNLARPIDRTNARAPRIIFQPERIILGHGLTC